VHPQQFRGKRQVIVSGVEHARDVPVHDARQPDLVDAKRTEISEREISAVLCTLPSLHRATSYMT
jgi:hypothetical protein